MTFIKLKNAFVMGGVATALLAASLGAQAASEKAVINITATVVDNTCTPDWGASTEVAMNRVSAKDFSNNQAGGSKDFTLNLTECGSGTTKVKVTASGTPDNTDNALFINSDTTGAAGYGVAVWGGPTQATQLNPTGSNSVEYDVENGAVKMPFVAKLMSTGLTPTKPGNLKSVVTLTVDYE